MTFFEPCEAGLQPVLSNRRSGTGKAYLKLVVPAGSLPSPLCPEFSSQGCQARESLLHSGSSLHGDTKPLIPTPTSGATG